MTQRVLPLAKKVHDLLAYRKGKLEVTGIVLGKPTWYRGKKVIKVSNGQKNLLRVEVCETEGKHVLHIYTNDHKITTVAIWQFALHNGVEFRN